MKVLHFVSGLAKTAGGPSRSVTALCSYLARRPEFEVLLAHQQTCDTPYIAACEPVVDVVLKTNSAWKQALGIPTRDFLKTLGKDNKPDLIHTHGIWNIPTARICNFALKSGIPLVMHPRGMLEPWALNFRKFKKSVALAAYQRNILKSASAFIATSEMERESIRRFGLLQPTYVIPNGIEIPPTGSKNKLTTGVKRALFLSRVHPKKGLINLIRAWARVRPADWKLTIAGPDELGHQKEVEQLVRKLTLEGAVEFVGDLDGSDKDDAYRKSDLFILPSFSENFGIVVLEAMTYGLPVITTKGTPWSILEEKNAGWWIDANEDSLTNALLCACNLPTGDLRNMGENCKMIADQFSWPAIARSTADTYKLILSDGRS